METQSRLTVPIWALLVDIDHYRVRGHDLRGAVNDRKSVATFLQQQYGVPERHILPLTNDRATRDGIIKAFNTFLIENPEIEFGDQILFGFFGHGSRMNDPIPNRTPDGKQESIVPYDSRTEGVYDIPDRTLGALLLRLAHAKGANITVILDCCHAGSGTRGAAAIRGLPDDPRPVPVELDRDIQAIFVSRDVEARQIPLQPHAHVLLAACRNNELAAEFSTLAPDSTPTWFGAFTHHLLKTLAILPVNSLYAELMERTAAQVSSQVSGQMPQCEGDHNRVIFAGVHERRDPFILAQLTAQGNVVVNAGSLQGLSQGTELAAYPPSVMTLADIPTTPLALLQIESVTATDAQARFLDAAMQTPLSPLHCVVTRFAYQGIRQQVMIYAEQPGEDDKHAQALHQTLQANTLTGYPSLYVGVAQQPENANLFVLASEGKLAIYDQTQTRALAEPEDIRRDGQTALLATRNSLESIARFRGIMTLTNRDRSSELAAKFLVRLRRYLPDLALDELPVVPRGAGGELQITLDHQHPEQNVYLIEITNHSPFQVYPHIFAMSPDYSVGRLYPNLGQQDALAPGVTYFVGAQSAEERLSFFLPMGWKQSQDYLKLVFTRSPSDLRIFEQGGLRVAPPAYVPRRGAASDLDDLIAAMLNDSGTRNMRVARQSALADWTTLEIPITTSVQAAHD